MLVAVYLCVMPQSVNKFIDPFGSGIIGVSQDPRINQVFPLVIRQLEVLQGVSEKHFKAILRPPPYGSDRYFQRPL